MLPQTTYETAAIALANLLNQDSIPTSESNRVKFFIASGVQRILRAFDWQQTIQFASITTDTNGRATLSTLPLGQFPAFETLTDGVHNYTYAYPSERYQYHNGDFAYNIVVENGLWVLYSSQPNATLTLGFYGTPDLAPGTNVAIAFQPMVIAKGALIYYRQAQDPEADTEQEEDQFRQEIAEIAEAQERRRPQKFATTRRDTMNHQLGYTGRGRGYYNGRYR